MGGVFTATGGEQRARSIRLGRRAAFDLNGEPLGEATGVHGESSRHRRECCSTLGIPARKGAWAPIAPCEGVVQDPQALLSFAAVFSSSFSGLSEVRSEAS